jgi:glycerate 2-kinase
MNTRIQNMEALLSTGNQAGRKAMVQILETGLQAADPYPNARRLVRIEKGKLIAGNRDFEPEGSPRSGEEVYDLSDIRNIYVVGAGKGVQNIARALEETLGDRLTAGHVIDKKGHPVILKKIGVTLGGHPAPDEDCVLGCEKILELAGDLTDRDLVFTCVANGVSSLLTLPAPGLTLADLRQTTLVTQIERGMTTRELSPIRNHLDRMKGGRISRYFHPAKMIHILGIDPGTYEQRMYENYWLHTLPDSTTFQQAVESLRRYDALEAVPRAVRRHLEKADPSQETVKAEDFEKMPFRIFGLMPGYWQSGKLYPAMKKARELGFKTAVVADRLIEIEASQAGIYLASMANTVEGRGLPFEPPCALFSSGELVVTVGKEKGFGGRNQEFVLSAALKITGSENIVIASVDTDGTDGPGSQFSGGSKDIPCLAGGIVDGWTVEEAERRKVDIIGELKRHNTTPALWNLGSGVVASPNISLIDLTVALILGRRKKKSFQVRPGFGV